jgi:hypothetical protein
MEFEHRGGGAPKGEPTDQRYNTPPEPEAEEGSGAEHQPPESSDNASKTEESDIRDGYEDFIFRGPFPMRGRDFPCKRSNSTTHEKA